MEIEPPALSEPPREARNRKLHTIEKNTCCGKIDQASYQRGLDHPDVHVSIVNALHVTTTG